MGNHWNIITSLKLNFKGGEGASYKKGGRKMIVFGWVVPKS
jgi:hypothetical protein